MRYIGILLIALFTIYSYIKGSNWKSLLILEKVVLIIGAIGTIIITYYTIKDFAKQNEEDGIMATFGEMSSKKTFQKTVSLQIAGSNVKLSSGLESMSFFKISENELKVALIDNRLCAYTIIRDIDGAVVAVIDGDNWKMYKPGYEYNNDENGFEVVTPDRRVLFQVDLQNDVAVLAGLFLSPSRNGFYFSAVPSSGVLPTGGATLVTITEGIARDDHGALGPFTLPSNKIVRLFEYPREKKLGVRAAQVRR